MEEKHVPYWREWRYDVQNERRRTLPEIIANREKKGYEDDYNVCRGPNQNLIEKF